MAITLFWRLFDNVYISVLKPLFNIVVDRFKKF